MNIAPSHQISSLVSRIGRSRTARRLTYAIRNRRIFEDLYQHDRMLADRVRVDAYRAALARYVKPTDVVVDLGTGTGVLSFLAARAGAKVVHAIEHGPMIERARAIARDNGFTNIVFHQCHSTRFNLPERADIIIHEQIGDTAFDERVIENVADLRDRILKPGGLVLPSRLALFIEPVQLQDDFNAPFAWQQSIDGITFRSLASMEDAQPHSYRYRSFRPFPFDRFLCEPDAVVQIDLGTARPSDLPKAIAYERTVVTPGRFDGFCVYFRAAFDDELSFSNSPAEKGTSWANSLLRVEPRDVHAGERIALRLTATDLADPESWSWNVR